MARKCQINDLALPGHVNLAKYKFTWPGSAKSLICEKHKQKLNKLKAIVYCQVIPLTEDELKAGKKCKQKGVNMKPSELIKVLQKAVNAGLDDTTEILFNTETRKYNYHMAKIGNAYFDKKIIGKSIVTLHEGE